MINNKKIKKILASSLILVTLSAPLTIKADEEYTFKKGDTFNRICFIKYRDLKYNYRVLMYNGLEEMNLKEGTKIVFPSEETLNSYSFWYKVKENEDLSLIALKFYGDILLGSLLGEYNCLDKEIKENDVLFIPSFNELMELNNACSRKVNKYVRKRNV